jgi:hypothetical protein
VLQRAKEERNILQTTKSRKAVWIGYILRRDCLLKHVIEGKIEERLEVVGRRRRKLKELLDDVTEREDTGKRKRTHSIAICGELALEEAMDLSLGREQNA